MQMYRPVGVKELQLVAESGWRRFPPRLFHQPIFYPVLVRSYAEAIDVVAGLAPHARSASLRRSPSAVTALLSPRRRAQA